MRRLGLVPVIVLATACVTAKVNRLVQTEYASGPPEDVTVLVDIRELHADTIRYEQIAVINLYGEGGGFTDRTSLLKRAREEAGKLGANAIILSDQTQDGSGSWVGVVSDNTGSAIAIRYEIVRDTS